MQDAHKPGNREIQLKTVFSDPLLDVMNFLNDVTSTYPRAISFAAGRPPDQFFNVEDHFQSIHRFIAERAKRLGKSEREVWQEIGQYKATNGIINDLIAQHLARDENVVVPPEAIMVTIGAQEAMAILMLGLFDPAGDLLLASDPAYIGITGFARIAGVRVIPVPSDAEGLDPERLEEALRNCRGQGRPRALYDVPDFNNPLGTVLSHRRRKDLLAICRRHDIFFIEDNPYGAYVYEGEKPTPLKALDENGTVIYIGTFSKTLFPSLRLGYLVADQRVQGGGGFLAQELSKVKSLVTGNSSALLQAVVGGILLENGSSFECIVRPKVEHLRRNRDTMLECLQVEFSGMHGLVSWNRPRGGFFLAMSLPFHFGKEELVACAAEFGVIVCPMNFFTLGSGYDRQIRLSFSCLEEEQIRLGVKRLAAFVRKRMAHAETFSVSGATL